LGVQYHHIICIAISRLKEMIERFSCCVDRRKELVEIEVEVDRPPEFDLSCSSKDSFISDVIQSALDIICTPDSPSCLGWI
jgi:hypothetical protein